jgi:hypothetical protein
VSDLFDAFPPPDDCGPYRGALPAQRHSHTSVAAAEMAAGGAETERRRVLEYIRAQGVAGATDDEVQQALGMPGNTQRPRRRELQKAGLVRITPRTRMTASGRMASVWVAA